MSHSQAIKGLEVHLQRLRKLGAIGEREIPRVMAETTELGKAIIQKTISGSFGDIPPHSGKSRVVPKTSVSDLVDTGFYRSNWQTSVTRKGDVVTGTISTNTEYALMLEYGFYGNVQVPSHERTSKTGKRFRVKSYSRKVSQRPFFVVRRSKIRIRRLLIDRAKAAVQRALTG